MAKAGYSLTTTFLIDDMTISASTLFIHGGGSSLTGVSGDTMLIARLPITIRDLELQPAASAGAVTLMGTNAPSLLERVRIRSDGAGIAIHGPVSLQEVVLDGVPGVSRNGIHLFSGAVADMQRVVMSGWDICVFVDATSPVQLTMKYVVAYNCASRALDLASAQGLIEFATIAHSGTDAGIGPRAVSCANAGTTLRSSIVWAPGATPRIPLAGCNVVSTIVGPTAIAGASNSDPKFVDGAGGNFLLMTGSPARDAVDVGPTIDAAGNPRPVGARFDLGAFESP